jgi:hypothetical protein
VISAVRGVVPRFSRPPHPPGLTRASSRKRQQNGGYAVRPFIRVGDLPEVVAGRSRLRRSDATRGPPIVSDGQQNTLAVPSSGRSRAQLVNLANIALYVVTRIVLVPLSGQASGECRFIG